MAAKHRVLQHHRRHRRQPDGHPHSRRQRVARRVGRGHPLVDRRALVINGLVVRPPFARTTDHTHRAQRDDERRHPQRRNHRPIHESDDRTSEENKDDSRNRPELALDQQCPNDAGKRNARPRGKIDAAAHNDHRHRDRPDRDDHRLREDDLEIVIGQKELTRFRGQGKQHDHQNEADERPAFREQVFERGFHR